MWIFLASFSMVLSAIRRVYDKRLTGYFGNFPLAFVMNLFSFVPFCVMLFIFPLPSDILNLPINFWVPLLVSALVYPLQVYCYFRAVREGEMSAVIPLVTLAPIFNIATSFVLVGEVPSTLGFIGIAIVVIAVYFLLKKKGTHFKSRPEMFMIASMFLLAVSASFDKIGIQASTPMWYVFMNALLGVLFTGILTFYTKEHVELKNIKHHFGGFVIVGLLLSLSYATMQFALLYGNTSYVLAIRSGVFVFPAIWGIFKLKEFVSLGKIIALGLFITGSILLAFA